MVAKVAKGLPTLASAREGREGGLMLAKLANGGSQVVVKVAKGLATVSDPLDCENPVA